MSKHGGRRQGAGRKPGILTTKTREIAEQAIQGGITPLDYMLAILRDPTLKPEDRFEAAKAAAPYVHPRLAAVEHSGDKDNPLAFAVLSGVPSVTDADDDDQRPTAPSH